MLNSVSYENQPYTLDETTEDIKSKNSNSLPIVVQLLITILEYFISPIVLSFIFKKRLNIKTAVIIVTLNAIFMFSLYIAVFRENAVFNLMPMVIWSIPSFLCIKKIHSLNLNDDIKTTPSAIITNNDELEATMYCSNDPYSIVPTYINEKSSVSDSKIEQKKTVSVDILSKNLLLKETKTLINIAFQ